MSLAVEHRQTFACFGAECGVIVSSAAGADETSAASAAAAARRRLLDWHDRFTRFDDSSELCRMNADPRATLPVSPIMRRVVEASVRTAALSGGLVDPTLGDELEAAGYDRDLPEPEIALRDALSLAPARRAGGPSASARWREFETSATEGTINRPPGVKLDGGGIAKGVFADELAGTLRDLGAFVVDCCGDLRVGGADGVLRPVRVASPFNASVLHTFELAAGGVATSGIGRRSWIDRAGRPAHHLLDPATGTPAFTGVVQVTALAPTATEAEMRSKAALLSGPAGAADWLPHGGLVVFDDGSHAVIDPPPAAG